MKYTNQEEIGKHFLNQAVKLVKEGKTFIFVIHNIDWALKVHDKRLDKRVKKVDLKNVDSKDLLELNQGKGMHSGTIENFSGKNFVQYI